ncbi:endonuclease/exonuclease/phosphatase family protein [Pedobacter sp. Du54]|uniref:endonuclease/exonuclease/phosphatase family protein n=1 Tax=Pedobacter anseongensis TaxID=3133439 RepID=UPI00309A0D03
MKTKRITIFDKLMFLIALVMAVGMFMGIRAGVSDPRQHMVFAFFGLAYPFFLLGNILSLVYWIIRTKWAIVAVTVVVIAYGGHTLIATFGFFGNQGELRKEDESLVRVMTYNVHNFTPYGEELSLSMKEKMLNVVAEQAPDIVCFQEFYTRKKGPYDIVDSLKRLLNVKYYYFIPTMKSERESIGMAIFSRFPIRDSGRIDFKGVTGNMSVFVDLQIRNKVIRVYNVHLQSISFGSEDYSYIDQVKDMDAKMGSSKRIARMIKGAFKKRSEQVDVMKAHMASCETPFIVAGDFNDTPASYVVTKMTDSLNNAFIMKGQGFGKTYNGKFPNFQIDYIATTKNIDVINYKIIEAKLSDHFPVRSDLRLKN